MQTSKSGGGRGSPAISSGSGSRASRLQAAEPPGGSGGLMSVGLGL